MTEKSERSIRAEKRNGKNPTLSDAEIQAAKDAKKDLILTKTTMTLYLLFWTCIRNVLLHFPNEELTNLLVVVIDWYANKNHYFITPHAINFLRLLVPILPLNLIRYYICSLCVRFKQLGDDGLPDDATMRALIPRFKVWVAFMDQKQLKKMLDAFHKAAAGTAAKNRDKQRRRTWPKNTRLGNKQNSLCNASVLFCTRSWNETHGSSSMKGTKRKSIISLEHGRVYKKCKVATDINQN